jgi:multicomponent Na+:H+ antiporter subunit D
MYHHHPAVLILLAVIGLIASLKNQKLFVSIALSYPLIVGLFFWGQSNSIIVSAYDIKFISDFSQQNKLIGYAFLLVLFSSNLYALGQNKRSEIILGSMYGAFSFLCLLAGDFISMITGLEFMMLTSSLIIFISGSRESSRASKKYLITHLISSNMIMMGVAYLIGQNGSTVMLEITPLILNPEYSKTILLIMLSGFIINIAAFPFSGWMVNCYSVASPSGFLYLISFTTKISIMLLLKLFAGYEYLKYVAILMILYSSVKALVEDSLPRLLCHLSIMQLGFMLLGISHGGRAILFATNLYLFVHIIYKSLLSISVATLIDQYKIHLCSDLKKINSKLLLVALVVSLGLMINIPITTSWYIKSEISAILAKDPTYYVIILLSIVTIIAIPLRQYFNASDMVKLNLNLCTKVSLYFMTFVAVVVGFLGKYIPVIKDIKTVDLFSISSLKQLIIIALSGLIMVFLKIPKNHHSTLNIIEWLSRVFLHFNHFIQKKFSHKEKKEYWSSRALERQFLRKFRALHNQQTAIFAVFSVFMIMLVSLKIYV